MYLSRLTIDVGNDPMREQPGRTWLRNLYRVHQRLCMAFPSEKRRTDDEHFLKPFHPDDFGNGQVHVERAESSGFLFRIDPGPNGRIVILVQSAAKPDWDYAFHNARHLLVDLGPNRDPWHCKPFNPSFTASQRLRFRLSANPTRRISKHSTDRDGKPIEEKWIGKRVPVPHDELLDWLADWRLRQDGRDEPSGFSIDRDRTRLQPGYVYVNKTRDGNGHRLFSVRYEGLLEVTDADAFRNTILRGIGPGKAFGFGLLSVAACDAPIAAEVA